MKGIWVIHLKTVVLAVFGLIAALTAAFLLYSYWPGRAIPADAPLSPSHQVFHMVTGEFSTTTEDGKKIEAYRWDPGVIVVNRGDTVTLKIAGVNGQSHPFVIEGLNIKGEVKKGEETTVTFKADKKGTYRLICFAHPDLAHNGPMIGYIVVR